MSRTFRYKKVVPHAVQVVDGQRFFHFRKKTPLWQLLDDTQFGHILMASRYGIGQYYRAVMERRYRRKTSALIRKGSDELIAHTYMRR